ncbi:MAG: hypothetical protein LIO58_02505 [Oscillospiraceae bacterium]|nr:hypothetical protein [Oscillospiraceae bacterium]
MAEEFAETIQEQSDEEYLKTLHRYDSDRWESGISYQTLQGDESEIRYEEFDMYNVLNYAYDGEFTYVKFGFNDSLDGYVLLRIDGAIS